MAKIRQRTIGNENVSVIGLGAMGMSSYYSGGGFMNNEDNNLKVLTDAADAGITFWDTSDVYGPYTNEELIGKWFKLTGRRSEIFLATKFAVAVDADGQMSIRGDHDYVLQACDASLKRLGTDYIDLYYQHRVDPKTKIEETVGAMAELVKQGKVKHLGLSECSGATLRRAYKIHPIAALQIEYSPFTLDIEHAQIGLKKTCEEMGVAIVAYSPLGRGLLTGKYKSRDDFGPDDSRLHLPRFNEENFSKNLDLVRKIEEIAEKKGCTPGQLTLAWLLAQSPNVIPIPGTTKAKNLAENIGALNLMLTSEEILDVRKVSEAADVYGDRYSKNMMLGVIADSI